MTFHDVQQNSDEWLALRCGKVTSSSIAKVMANFGKTFGDPAKQLAAKLAIEQITGKPVGGHYSNANMDRGHEQEPIAKALYEYDNFCSVSNGGFFDNGKTGDSPDGLVDSDGVLEIKCVLGHVQVATIRRGTFDPAYKWQLIFHLRETRRDWVDYVSYSSDFPEGKQLYQFRVYRDMFASEFDMVDERLIQFEKIVCEAKEIVRG